MHELLRLEEDEKLVLTPFEKNIEVWRQLWRVLERSDIVVQVRLLARACNHSCTPACALLCLLSDRLDHYVSTPD